ncbi:MAG: hypothetical protein LUE91_06700, partial [Oscillospiraceae bacterium]|nr:hypothetical protein [Oscillospiraceae bacterium]
LLNFCTEVFNLHLQFSIFFHSCPPAALGFIFLFYRPFPTAAKGNLPKMGWNIGNLLVNFHMACQK